MAQPTPMMNMRYFQNILSLSHVLREGNGVGAVLARGASASFTMSVVGIGMAFSVNVLLARAMGVTQYGLYIYSLTWINVLALLCKFGTGSSLIRYIAAYHATGNWSLLRGVLQQSIFFVFSLSLIIGTVAVAGISLLPDRISSDQTYVAYVALCLLPVLALSGNVEASLRGLRRILQSGIPDSFIRPFAIFLLAGSFYLITEQQLTASTVMTFNVLGALFAIFFGGRWLLKSLPNQVLSAKSDFNTQEWIKVTFPLFVMSVLNLLLSQTDLLMIGVFLDHDSAGIYAVVSRISGLTTLGLTAANSIVAPLISELYNTRNIPLLQRMVAISARGIFAYTIVSVLGLVFFGKFLLGIFGEKFTAGYTPLLLLLAGQVVNALTGSVGFLMTMTGHQNKAAQILAFCAVLNIVLNASLIPAYGLVGAAMATAISTASWNLLMLKYVWQNLKINPTITSKL